MKKIFKITRTKIYPEHDCVELTLHEAVNYAGVWSNYIRCANRPPFNQWQAGDKVGIDLFKLSMPSNFPSMIYNDNSLISKLTNNHPLWYQKEVINDDELGQGWVEEGD